MSENIVHENNLAIMHVGMMLAVWDKENNKLPLGLKEANERIERVFKVDMYTEPNIITARNKIAAIIEHKIGDTIEH